MFAFCCAAKSFGELKSLQLRQISVVIVVVAIIGLALGVAAVYGMYPGNTVTETSNCCVDLGLNISTPCSTFENPNYAPVQRLKHLIETDPNFIAAEQGLNYKSPYGGWGRGGTFDSSGAVNSTTIYFYFPYTTNRLYTDNRGNVGNFTNYITVKVPLTETGYNMSAIQITSSNDSEITVTCSLTT